MAIQVIQTPTGKRYRDTVTNRFVSAPSRKPRSAASKKRSAKVRASKGLCAKPVDSKLHCAIDAHVRKHKRGHRVVPCCASNPVRKSSRKSSRKSAKKSSKKRSISARDGMCGASL